jgi:hypothetical protein
MGAFALTASETIFIWGGAATAAYGVYLWGPTVIALLQKIPVPQAAKYFVFVTGSGTIGKIVVSFVAPLIGRSALGVLWGFSGGAGGRLDDPSPGFLWSTDGRRRTTVSSRPR